MRPQFLPGHDGLASIRMKAKTHGADPVLTQACIVPRWTTTSPGTSSPSMGRT
jgi:hypothetical protein